MKQTGLLAASLCGAVLVATLTALVANLLVVRYLEQDTDRRLERVALRYSAQPETLLGAQSSEPRSQSDTTQSFANAGLAVRVTDNAGLVIRSAPQFGENFTIPETVLAQNGQGEPAFLTVDFEGTPLRVLSTPVLDPDNASLLGTVQVAESLQPMLRLQRNLTGVLLAGVLLQVSMLIGGYWITTGRGRNATNLGRPATT